MAFTSSVSGNSAPVHVMSWDFGDGGSSFPRDPTHAFNYTGEFLVEALVSLTSSLSSNSSLGPGATYELDLLVQPGGKLAIASDTYQYDPMLNG